MKKRIIGIFIIICILVSLMPTTLAAGTHSHKVCAVGCTNPNHSENHGDTVEWTAWDKDNELPSESGSYYLTKHVTLESTWVVGANISLDLNGYTVTLEEGATGSVIKVIDNSIFTLCDCKNKGQVIGINARNNTEPGGAVYVLSGSTFNLYSGIITDTIITNKYGDHDVYNCGTFNMYGGTVTGANSGHYKNTRSQFVKIHNFNTGTFNMYGGKTSGIWGGIKWTFEVKDSGGKGKMTVEPVSEDTPAISRWANHYYKLNESDVPSATYARGEWPACVVEDCSAYYMPWTYHRAKITSLEIKEGVKSVGSFAFDTLTNVAGELTIPKTVEYIGHQAFATCRFTKITFAVDPITRESELHCIAQGAFTKCYITELVLPEGLHDIHGSAFGTSTKLETVHIPASVKFMGGWNGHLDYGWGVVSSGYTIFPYCTALRKITFGDEAVRDLFMYREASYSIAKPSGYDQRVHIDAYIGLTAYVFITDAINDSEEGDVIAAVVPSNPANRKPVVIDANEVAVIPEGVTLVIPENLTLTNKGTLANSGTISGGGTLTNNSTYAASDTAVVEGTLTINGSGTTSSAIVFDVKGGNEVIAPIVAEAGTDISQYASQIPKPTKTGYSFFGWSSIIPDTMPEDGMTISAVWDWVAPKYAITTDVEGIEVPQHAQLGSTVEITVEEGAQIDSIKVIDSNGNKLKVERTEDGYTFEMPAGGVKIEEIVNVFNDVEKTDYYFDAVLWAADSEVVEGTAEDEFSPEETCTRAQMATILWRAAGCPEPTSDVSKFTDVDAESYYAKAVLWAAEQGITTGTSETEFSPDEQCSRAQIIAFLARMLNGTSENRELAFDDVDADAYYAQYVMWALEKGITTGTGETTFEPDEFCTRAQAVVFLWRCIGK